jgi:hypothetical protein
VSFVRACPLFPPNRISQTPLPLPSRMDLTARIAALVTALDLEPKSVHEEDKLRWSYEERKWALERQAWDLERQSWDRERDAWKKLVHKSKPLINDTTSASASLGLSPRDGRRVTVFWPVNEPGELDASTRLAPGLSAYR